MVVLIGGVSLCGFRPFGWTDYPNLEVVIVDDSDTPLSETAIGDHILSHPLVKYYYIQERMSIGAKRNFAAERCSGSVIVTWDDDDYHRSFRVSRQVAPILSGAADVTTLAHGMYLYVHGMQFYNWTLGKDGARSPHFGTLVYRRSMWANGGVRYPDTSFGEDYGFAERALDAGFRHATLDNTDGAFVYVRHHNTWVMSAAVKAQVFKHLAVMEAPSWMTPAEQQFFEVEAAKSVAPSAINYKL